MYVLPYLVCRYDRFLEHVPDAAEQAGDLHQPGDVVLLQHHRPAADQLKNLSR